MQTERLLEQMLKGISALRELGAEQKITYGDWSGTMGIVPRGVGRQLDAIAALAKFAHDQPLVDAVNRVVLASTNEPGIGAQRDMRIIDVNAIREVIGDTTNDDVEAAA